MRNSWGESWGDKGYCYVPYDYAGNSDFNFLGQYAIYGLTETDFTPEPEEDEAPLYERYLALCRLVFRQVKSSHVCVCVCDRTPEDDEEPDIEVEEDDVEEAGEGVDISDMFDPLAEARKAFNMFDSDGSGSLNIR